MRKKLLAVLLVAMMVLMAGCGTKAPEVKPVELTVWHYFSGAQKDALDAIVADFNATVGKENQITVTAENQGTTADLQKKVQTAAEAGLANLPDIIHGYPDITATLHEKGFIADMGSYVSTEDLADYYEGFIAEGSQFEGGEFRLMPVAKSSELLFLNRTLWDNIKVQIGCTDEDLTNWDGIAKAGKAYTAQTGKAFFGIDSLANFFYLSGYQQGIEFVTPGKFTSDEATEQKIYNFVADGIADGWLVTKDANKKYNSDFMNDGTAVCYVGSNSGTTYLNPKTDKNQATEDTLNCLSYPVWTGATAAVIQQGAGMSIAKKGEDKEKAAVKFLLFLTNADNTAKFSMASGYLPVRKSASENKTFSDFLAGKDAAGNALALPAAKVSMAVNAVLTQFKTYETYYTPAFTNSNVIRDKVDEQMMKIVTKTYTDFQTFYTNLNTEVQAIITGR
ncbi:MAG TPA: extracellular solute-binding protein [Bacillota bacterium]|nr:extracellular solute-binding protein [Bacillota bacterium]